MKEIINIKKETIGITGMTCASCVASIEKALKKQTGIHDVIVNLAMLVVPVGYCWIKEIQFKRH